MKHGKTDSTGCRQSRIVFVCTDMQNDTRGGEGTNGARLAFADALKHIDAAIAAGAYSKAAEVARAEAAQTETEN